MSADAMSPADRIRRFVSEWPMSGGHPDEIYSLWVRNEDEPRRLLKSDITALLDGRGRHIPPADSEQRGLRAKRLRMLLDRAAPRPWKLEIQGADLIIHNLDEDGLGLHIAWWDVHVWADQGREGIDGADARLIVEAVNALSDLLDERDRLTEAVRLIERWGCQASAFHGEDPLVWDRCLDYEYRATEPTGDPNEDRCAACLAHAALGAAS